METSGNNVEMQVLQLDDRTRARLAVRLIRSLDPVDRLTSDQVDALWLQEAEDRLGRMESGEDPGVEVGQAISEARKKLDS